jgi:hypothetical protein
LFSDTCNICSLLRVRDHVSHPYKTSKNFLYILVFCIYFFHNILLNIACKSFGKRAFGRPRLIAD